MWANQSPPSIKLDLKKSKIQPIYFIMLLIFSGRGVVLSRIKLSCNWIFNCNFPKIKLIMQHITFFSQLGRIKSKCTSSRLILVEKRVSTESSKFHYHFKTDLLHMNFFSIVYKFWLEVCTGFEIICIGLWLGKRDNRTWQHGSPRGWISLTVKNFSQRLTLMIIYCFWLN